MSHDLPVTLIQEHSIPEDFMVQLDTIIRDSATYENNAVITISGIHRQFDGYQEAILEASLEGDENFTLAKDMDLDQVMNFVDYIRDNANIKQKFSHFATEQLDNLIMVVFSGDVDHLLMGQQLQEFVFSRTEYQGLATQIKFLIKKGRSMEITYDIMAEIHADTSTEEKEQIKALGLDEDHKPSNPNKLIPILSMTFKSFEKLLG